MDGVATDADVVLVVLGAWDVFDLELDGQRLAFGILEVPCHVYIPGANLIYTTIGPELLELV